MNHFQRYLLDEFVEDYREGEMSRREFVMKVIGVSGGLAAAMGLFSSVGLNEAEIAAAQTAPRVAQAGPNPVTIAPDDPAITVMDVSFPTADGSTILGYMAMPSVGGTYSGIVVIHENQGLRDHFKDVARRYAKEGFAALALDLVSREGGTDNANPDQVPGFLGTADPQRHVGDSIAAGAFLRQQPGVRSDMHGMTGFCFGGGVVWETIGQDLSIVAAVPYYGTPTPSAESLAHTRAASLAFYGDQDRLSGSAAVIQDALETAGVPHDYKIYPGAGHAFFNDTRTSYNEAAARDSWMHAVGWFREYLPTM
jgi:carboxymethylenebutenolidase